MRFSKFILVSVAAVFLMAADAPRKDDLVELSGWLNARSEAKFRKADTNTLFTLKPGTRGSIEEVKHFPGSKNYGICVRILSGSRVDKPNRCMWVYFNPKKPNMKLYSVGNNTDAKNDKLAEWAINPKKVPSIVVTEVPTSADAAEVTKTTPAIAEPEVAPETPAAPATGVDSATPIDSELLAKSSIGTLDQMNQNAPLGRDLTDPNSGCPDGKCFTGIGTQEQCTSTNDYLEKKITEISKKDPMSSVLSMQSDDMINKQCVQRAMEIFPPGKQFYRSDSCLWAKHIPRPCVSSAYVDMTAKSFNAVAKCMSPILSGSNNIRDQKQAAYSVFSLMSQESGLHTNAVSGTGAGGVTQLTKPAIQDVNNNIERYKEALRQSSNPLCSKSLLGVLDEPMPTKAISSSSARSCSRISLDKNNPLKSMIYGFAFQTVVKDYLQNSLFERFVGVFSQMSPALLDGLKLKLAMWGHNAGAGGIAYPAEQVLTQMRRSNQRIETAADIDTFMGKLEIAMLHSPGPENRKRGRPVETSIYYPKIIERMRTIEPLGGQTCIAQ